MTNYEWIKKHTLMEIIKDTLNKAYTIYDDEEQTVFVSWLLEEHKEEYKDVQLPKNTKSKDGGPNLSF